LHALFASEVDQAALSAQDFMPRHTVQFHWHNRDAQGRAFESFETFLASLTQDKRKKIRQERRKVSDAGVTFRHSPGAAISASDWAFFLPLLRAHLPGARKRALPHTRLL
jgi:hypothetical protein